MPTPTTSAKIIHIYGHVSASPAAVASLFSGIVADNPVGDSDLAIFCVNPSAGIDPLTISQWQALDEFQIPRLLIVNGLEGQEYDFEDAIQLANRVFDQVITPFLVLHADDGAAIALIDLINLSIRNYSTKTITIESAESEHIEMVQEFRDELLEQLAEMDTGAFAAGIQFPAIPINITSGLGVDIVNEYIDLLPGRS